MLVAIQPDNYGPSDASSPIWARLLREAGHEVREVDVRRADILEQLRGCDGFMWRHGHHPSMRLIARRLLPVIEGQLGLAVYPDQKTCWHYDDKIAQAYLLRAAGIPMPRTWIWFDREEAAAWARQAEYPLVIKLWAGAGSSNVRLVPDAAAALGWIGRCFDAGVTSLEEPVTGRLGRLRQAMSRYAPAPWEIHRGYVLFQEFLPGNAFDTRVTVIGDRAFGYRRFNRPGDFRASGSGNFDVDPAGIDAGLVQLAFETARRLDVQSVAIDGLRDGDRRLVTEVSYTYVSWMVESCPGHWDSGLNWFSGRMWPEEAQVLDFLARLESRKGRS
jgi:glutathione synthase/RimK-type ligase-like ATP-grasp enzyme